MLLRIACGPAGFWLAVALAACGNTKRSPSGGAIAEGGAEGAATPQSPGPGGAVTGTSGALAQGGAPNMAAGAAGSPQAGGAAGAAGCIEGALCTCGELTGTLACGDAETSDDGQCSCPPANECEAPSGSCFEPCGGDALGLWVLEQTCFTGAKTGQGCAGGTVEGTSSENDLKVLILENEPVVVSGSESLALRAQVPLQCLGIETVNRCKNAQFYASPLFFGFSQPLDCEASACGFCECSGDVWGGGGSGRPWVPGAETLAFGALNVPYCVEGDTMWAGGGELAGEPKVAYKFRRRSCVGEPLPCAKRESEQCGTSGDCRPGRCMPDGGDAAVCADQSYEEYCSLEPGCKWVAGGCWGTASETCDYNYCEGTPGCSWGEPTPRCGGVPAPCYTHDLSTCSVAGCSARTCDVPDGWGGVESAPCERLTASACAEAAGCTVSGAACTGTATCGAQTNATVCAMLECAAYEEPMCGGHPTTSCTELSVEDCRAEPGCRLEW